MKEYDFIDIKVSRRLDAAIDVTALAEWVDTDCVIRASEGVKTITPGSGKLFRFHIGDAYTNHWERAEAVKARIAIAREAIEARLGSAGVPFTIENQELIAYGEQVSNKFPFAIHVTLRALGLAWPKIRASRRDNVIDLERDTKRPETAALQVDVEPPGFPRLARPRSSLSFTADVQDQTGARDLLGALSFQLLKPSDQQVFLPIPDGIGSFDLEYAEKDGRLQPQGLLFAFQSRALIEAARAGKTRLRLSVRFSTQDGAEAGVSEVALDLQGDVRDRVHITWACEGRIREFGPYHVDDATAAADLGEVACAGLDEGALLAAEPRLSVTIEPANARVEVRAQLGGENFGMLKATPGRQGSAARSFSLPLSSWLATLAQRRALRFPEALELELGFEAQGKSGAVALRGDVTRASPRPEWVACIDFGASTTAIWLGRAQGEQRGRPLALGAWLAGIDTGARLGETDTDETLLPSDVGLSSQFHLRASLDPLSLGDLSLALPGREAAARRLAALGLTYDVSVPFPSRAVMRRRFDGQTMPGYLSAIVPELKRALLRHAAPFDLPIRVLRRDGDHVDDVEQVDPALLMGDVFSALGGYVAPRAIAREASAAADNVQSGDLGAPREVIAKGRADLRDIANARVEGRPFLIVVTHPYGVKGDLAAIYARAAQRFAQSFAPGDDGAGHRVALVPEALAAAQFGIETFPFAAAAAGAGDDIVDYLTFDIGAGTFDASLISRRAKASLWSVAQHFGVALGGADIDGALLDLVVEILLEADASGLRAGFVLRDGFAGAQAPERRVLARQIQSAKARLNATLRARPGSYHAGDESLWLCVGVVKDPDGDVAWPVAFRPDATREPIRGEGWTLSVENSAVHSRELRLEIKPACLTSQRRSAKALDDVTRVLGDALPRMALSLASPERRKCVIVTGRAALWPPLHALIRAGAEAFGARLSSEQPLSPREMKEAVVSGAVTLATNPAQLSQAERALFSPLAMLVYVKAERGREGLTRHRAIRDITLLPEPGAPEILVDIAQTFVIASVIPGLARAEGLAERMALFERLYERHPVRPYTVLSGDIEPLRHLGAGRHWVSATAVEARVELRFRPDDGEGEARIIPVLREGRFYG